MSVPPRIANYGPSRVWIAIRRVGPVLAFLEILAAMALFGCDARASEGDWTADSGWTADRGVTVTFSYGPFDNVISGGSSTAEVIAWNWCPPPRPLLDHDLCGDGCKMVSRVVTVDGDSFNCRCGDGKTLPWKQEPIELELRP